ncbi:glycerol-3-phosphate 1-O-acyltransferase PlsY [Enterococcus hirae]|nr:glycerol-3-phosphate 1-O-acyltransferase PlsY [Enterococcus hirae]
MKIIILFLLAYLIGSIPSGLWVGKRFFHKDIRNYGSGNLGTTNTFRILGKPAGTIVFFMDVLKGTLATLLPYFFHLSGINPLFFGFAAIIGHMFPIFADFKGGKAVATSAGMLLGYNPAFGLFAFMIFFLLIFLTSRVSIASTLGVLLVLIATFIFPLTHFFILPRFDWLLTLMALVMTIAIWIRHRANFKRIMNGTESMVHFGMVYWKQAKQSTK